MEIIQKNLSNHVLTSAIEENLFTFFHLFNLWEQAEVNINPRWMSSFTNIPFPIFNGVLRTRLESNEVEEAIETVVSQAQLRNVPMLWWIGPSTQPEDLPDNLERHGFVQSGESPGMALDLSVLKHSATAGLNLVIEPVADNVALQTWCDVFAISFGMPRFVAEAFFDLHATVGFAKETTLFHYLGWLDGEPVATVSLFLGGGVAGIYNVATIPEARRKGIGAMITTKALNDAKEKGYKIGVLSSSEMGFGVYRSLGFQEYCKISQYLWSPQPEQDSK